jgi:F0F1-type ATP synthase membrane subunit b/b'
VTITPGVSIVLSFVGFVWIFMKKARKFMIEALDEHINLVKNKINNAELLEKEASLALKEAYVKKNEIIELIEKSRRESEEKIRQLHLENEQYISTLREKFDTSLKNQMEAELAKQKKLLLSQLSDQITKKLTEQINSANCNVSIDFTKDDLQKLI